VLTLNQVCGFKFQAFTGSPIHPHLGALNKNKAFAPKNTKIKNIGLFICNALNLGVEFFSSFYSPNSGVTLFSFPVSLLLPNFKAV
jgi:hypothetical protein